MHTIPSVCDFLSLPHYNENLGPLELEDPMDPPLPAAESPSEPEVTPEAESASESEPTDDDEYINKHAPKPVIPIEQRKETRRIKNLEAARRSRARKQEQLDRLEKLERSIFEFSNQIDELATGRLSTDITTSVRVLQGHSKRKDSVATLAQLKEIFNKVVKATTTIQSNLSQYGGKLHELCE